MILLLNPIIFINTPWPEISNVSTIKTEGYSQPWWLLSGCVYNSASITIPPTQLTLPHSQDSLYRFSFTKCPLHAATWPEVHPGSLHYLFGVRTPCVTLSWSSLWVASSPHIFLANSSLFLTLYSTLWQNQCPQSTYYPIPDMCTDSGPDGITVYPCQLSIYNSSEALWCVLHSAPLLPLLSSFLGPTLPQNGQLESPVGIWFSWTIVQPPTATIAKRGLQWYIISSMTGNQKCISPQSLMEQDSWEMDSRCSTGCLRRSASHAPVTTLQSFPTFSQPFS